MYFILENCLLRSNSYVIIKHITKWVTSFFSYFLQKWAVCFSTIMRQLQVYKWPSSESEPACIYKGCCLIEESTHEQSACCSIAVLLMCSNCVVECKSWWEKQKRLVSSSVLIVTVRRQTHTFHNYRSVPMRVCLEALDRVVLHLTNAQV